MRAFFASLALLLSSTFAFSGVAIAGGGNVARKPTAKMFELYHKTPSAKGTVLLFHGFSNTTEMWREEAQHLHRRGYDVLVAPLPGHGFVDKNGKEDISRVPRAHESQKYEKFASAMFDRAAKRSGMVHVAGFSVGGAHAALLGLSKRDVRNADGSKVLRSMLAINPYLSPPPKKFGPFKIDFDHVASVADKFTLGLASRWLAKKPYRFDNAIRRAAAGSLDVGLTQVTYGNVFGIGRLGDRVQALAKTWSVEPEGQRLPSAVIITEHDPTASPAASAELARQIGAKSVVIASNLHNLVTREANPDAASRALVRKTLLETFAAGVAANR